MNRRYYIDKMSKHTFHSLLIMVTSAKGHDQLHTPKLVHRIFMFPSTSQWNQLQR